MTTKIIIFLTIVLFSTMSLSAQEVEKSAISISSVSISAGWYKPSMNYWNNTFLPTANATDRFNGSLIYGGDISFDLPSNLGVRAGAWYWGEQVNGKDGGAFNTLKVNFTGLSLGAFYKYRPGIFGIKPYLGVDGSCLIIQDRYDITGSVIKKSGNDIVYSPFVGIEHVFNKNIVLGIEYGYNVGSYVQDVETATGPSNAKVSIDGSKFQFKIGYKFP
ncbi:MAG: outer membrane beta-barrel protein, partial [Bacteroidetes bacterium]|nr:outer membrane beta-barrel protein [Bacteroidota bacterium]